MNQVFKRKRFLHFLLLLFISATSFKSAALPKEKIDSIAGYFLKHSGSSCIVIGISDNGKTTLFWYGTINKTSDQKADSNTLFEIGSLTKLFTATATAIEVHKGNLKYSDSLSTLLPGIHAPGYAGHEIKVIDLLHHTSGLPRIPTDLFTSGKNFDSLNPYKIYAVANLDTFISKYRLEGMPGTSFAYSNLGFGLMGNILSKIESKPYESIISEEIWKPLNMLHTTITLSDAQKKIMASPYSVVGTPDHVWDFDALAGCGAIRSDINDMMKFLNASMRPFSLKDTLLRLAILDCENKLFDASQNHKVGLGWHIEPFNFDRLYFHEDGTGGYRSFIGFTKEGQKGVVILTNSATGTSETAVKVLNLIAADK